MTFLCVLGLVVTVPALGCAGSGAAGDICQMWLEAPQQFHDRWGLLRCWLSLRASAVIVLIAP